MEADELETLNDGLFCCLVLKTRAGVGPVTSDSLLPWCLWGMGYRFDFGGAVDTSYPTFFSVSWQTDDKVDNENP